MKIKVHGPVVEIRAYFGKSALNDPKMTLIRSGLKTPICMQYVAKIAAGLNSCDPIQWDLHFNQSIGRKL